MTLTMDGERIITTSVHREVVRTSPIVLRESSDGTRRLVFFATIVDRPDALRGCFVDQRKLKGDEWQDVRDIPMSSLKSGEGYAIQLRSSEFSTLIDGLLARKSIFERHGIVFGEHEYVSVDDLPAIVRGIIDSPDSELAGVLAGLDEADILNLGRKVDISKLDMLLSEWRQNATVSSEEFWQGLLTRNTWVFSQLVGSPVVLLKDKAYVGGKGIENAGGGEIDYLVKNELTENVAFIEIKAPTTPICGAAYRTSGALALSKDLTGGMIQVLGYKNTFAAELHRFQRDSKATFEAYEPRCVLILGTASAMSSEELASFELFRSALAGIQIWTFDEVEARLKGIRDVLRSTDDD